MNYYPLIQSANQVAAGPLGEKHTAVFFDTIISVGNMQYTFILAVYDNATNKPCYFVASEVNALAAKFGGGSHFLGVFPGDGHMNLGDSNDWADAKKFLPKALELAARQFGTVQPNIG